MIGKLNRKGDKAMDYIKVIENDKGNVHIEYYKNGKIYARICNLNLSDEPDGYNDIVRLLQSRYEYEDIDNYGWYDINGNKYNEVDARGGVLTVEDIIDDLKHALDTI